MSEKYYSVCINKKHWSDLIDIDDFLEKGFTVGECRRGIADKSLYMNGRLVAKLFKSKTQAALYAFSDK
jgi:hypothetical protein